MQKRLKDLIILYVEDEAPIRQNAVEYLSRHCDTVLEAQNAKEALNIYEKEKPHLIISDIKMPQMSGLEMTEIIRKNDKKIPIIITTAHTETAYLLKAVELNLVKYIVKPITTSKLQEALEMALELINETQVNLLKLSEETSFDLLNHTLFIKSERIKLTKNEQLLLELLAKHHQRVVSYQEIENLIWTYEGMSIDALRSLVRTLRKKLQGNYIENVSGIGYQLLTC
ncbi:MAG TPA: response regulator transcription factor [Campylobacterales bacterium]|nr:response regulator transcription factor [Campylobacterales bacterium]